MAKKKAVAKYDIPPEAVAAVRSLGERVAEVFSAPEPVEEDASPAVVAAVEAFSALDTEAGAWLAEAEAVRVAWQAGPVSPEEVKRLLGVAIDLVGRYRA